jgi:cytochrome c-type biogenesis protein
VILPALFFVMGLSTIFLLLGFTASAFGALFLQNQVLLLARIAGVVIIIFGLHFLGVFRIAILDREMRMDAGDRGGSALGPMCWGWPSPLAGRPASARNWARSCRWRRRKAAWSGARCFWVSMRWGWACRSCWPRFSSNDQWAFMAKLKKHMKLIERLMGTLLLIVWAGAADRGLHRLQLLDAGDL